MDKVSVANSTPSRVGERQRHSVIGVIPLQLRRPLYIYMHSILVSEQTYTYDGAMSIFNIQFER